MSSSSSLRGSFSDKLKSNIKYSFLIKILHVVTNLYLVRISIQLAGETNYGFWLTFLSIFTWFSCLEVGLNNGFRRKLTEYFDKNETTLFTKTTGQMFTQSIIHYGGVVPLLIGIIYFMPVETVFGTNNLDAGQLKWLLLVCLLFYFAHFVLYTLNSILLSIHRTRDSYFWLFLQSVLSLSAFLIIQFSEVSIGIVEISLVYSAAPFLTWAIAAIYYKSRIGISFWHGDGDSAFKSRLLIWGSTTKFFIIQIATLTIFSTDHMAILTLVSPGEVTGYQVAYKYFNILFIAFNVILLPFWAAFTSASHQNSSTWIKDKLKQLSGLWFLFLIGGIAMAFLAENVYAIWLNKNLQIPFLLTVIVGLFILQLIWNSIYSNYLNATESINSQVWLLSMGALVNIPLSIFLGQQIGASGIILSSCICLFPLSIVMPLQTFISLRKKN